MTVQTNGLASFAAAVVAASVKAYRGRGYGKVTLTLPEGCDRDLFIRWLAVVLAHRDTIEAYCTARWEARKGQIGYGSTAALTDVMAKIEAEGLDGLSDDELVAVSLLCKPELNEAGFQLAAWNRKSGRAPREQFRHWGV